MLDRLASGKVVELDDEDREVLNDVVVEIAQATEMCRIYTDIVANTMGAYGNVISNNLNCSYEGLGDHHGHHDDPQHCLWVLRHEHGVAAAELELGVPPCHSHGGLCRDAVCVHQGKGVQIGRPCSRVLSTCVFVRRS